MPAEDRDPLVAAELGEAEKLAIVSAPRHLRDGYEAVFALDGILSRVALSRREPLPAQLRLAWWRDACAELPGRGGHPVLGALARSWTADPAPLGSLIDAWEEVVVLPQGFSAAVESVAQARGGVVCVLTGAPLDIALPDARSWTLATLADHSEDHAQRTALRQAAVRGAQVRQARSLRPLAVLAGLARRAVIAKRSGLLGDRWSPIVAMRLGILGR